MGTDGVECVRQFQREAFIGDVDDQIVAWKSIVGHIAAVIARMVTGKYEEILKPSRMEGYTDAEPGRSF